MLEADVDKRCWMSSEDDEEYGELEDGGGDDEPYF
jgi:hypothetical protein